MSRHHLSPHKKLFFVFNTDVLHVKGPEALLRANTVWGALRGKFYVVSLLFFSIKNISAVTLGNQA